MTMTTPNDNNDVVAAETRRESGTAPRSVAEHDAPSSSSSSFSSSASEHDPRARLETSFTVELEDDTDDDVSSFATDRLSTEDEDDHEEEHHSDHASEHHSEDHQSEDHHSKNHEKQSNDHEGHSNHHEEDQHSEKETRASERGTIDEHEKNTKKKETKKFAEEAANAAERKEHRRLAEANSTLRKEKERLSRRYKELSDKYTSLKVTSALSSSALEIRLHKIKDELRKTEARLEREREEHRRSKSKQKEDEEALSKQRRAHDRLRHLREDLERRRTTSRADRERLVEAQRTVHELRKRNAALTRRIREGKEEETTATSAAGDERSETLRSVVVGDDERTSFSLATEKERGSSETESERLRLDNEALHERVRWLLRENDRIAQGDRETTTEGDAIKKSNTTGKVVVNDQDGAFSVQRNERNERAENRMPPQPPSFIANGVFDRDNVREHDDNDHDDDDNETATLRTELTRLRAWAERAADYVKRLQRDSAESRCTLEQRIADLESSERGGVGGGGDGALSVGSISALSTSVGGLGDDWSFGDDVDGARSQQQIPSRRYLFPRSNTNHTTTTNNNNNNRPTLKALVHEVVDLRRREASGRLEIASLESEREALSLKIAALEKALYEERTTPITTTTSPPPSVHKHEEEDLEQRRRREETNALRRENLSLSLRLRAAERANERRSTTLDENDDASSSFEEDEEDYRRASVRRLRARVSSEKRRTTTLKRYVGMLERALAASRSSRRNDADPLVAEVLEILKHRDHDDHHEIVNRLELDAMRRVAAADAAERRIRDLVRELETVRRERDDVVEERLAAEKDHRRRAEERDARLARLEATARTTLGTRTGRGAGRAPRRKGNDSSSSSSSSFSESDDAETTDDSSSTSTGSDSGHREDNDEDDHALS